MAAAIGAIRAALQPCADDLDEDVLQYLKSILLDCKSVGEVVETAATFIPGFADNTEKQQQAMAVKLQKAMKDGGSGGCSSSSAVGAGGRRSKPGAGHGLASSSTGMVIDIKPGATEEEIWAAGAAAAAAVAAGAGSSTADNAGADGGDEENDELRPRSEFEVLLSRVEPVLVSELRSLFPHLSEQAAQFALGRNNNTVAAAAEYVLENDVEAELNDELEKEKKREVDTARRRAAADAEAARAKAATLKRFDEREDDSGKSYRPSIPKEMQTTYKKGEKVLKYLDGRPVYMRPGDKFFEVGCAGWLPVSERRDRSAFTTCLFLLSLRSRSRLYHDAAGAEAGVRDGALVEGEEEGARWLKPGLREVRCTAMSPRFARVRRGRPPIRLQHRSDSQDNRL